jgi:pilus assembly protein CpaE
MNDKFLSVGFIGPNDANRLAITRELSGPEVGVLRDYYRYPNPDEVPALVAESHDVVLIDLDTDPEKALELVSTVSSDRVTTVMVYSANANQNLMLRSLQSGAQEFLSVPVAPGALSGAMTRAAARRPASSRIDGSLGELFVFVGVKGGVGVTLLATNFALLMAQESGKKTLLIDLDLPLGDIALNLGLTGKYSTVDALQNASRLDTNFLSHLLQSYQELSVLAAPGHFVNVVSNDRAIDKLIALARREFDYVVVDSGSRLNFVETDLYKDAEAIYMVVQTGVPELRNANRLVGQFPIGGSPKLQMVINRYTNSFRGIDEKTISNALTRPPDWKIPNDYVTAFRTQSTAKPLALENSPISKILREMARSACGLKEATVEKKRRVFGIAFSAG